MHSVALCVQAWPFYKCSRISLACNRHSTAVRQSVRLSAFIPWLVLCVVSPLSHWPLGFAVWAAWKGARVCVCVWLQCVFGWLCIWQAVVLWKSSAVTQRLTHFDMIGVRNFAGFPIIVPVGKVSFACHYAKSLKWEFHLYSLPKANQIVPFIDCFSKAHLFYAQTTLQRSDKPSCGT